MTIDAGAAEVFVLTHARLLERLRLDVLLHDGPARAVLTALAAYQNDDGGFGRGLEPDVRAPHSEVTATLSALELFESHGALDQAAAARALRWVGRVARPDGGLPFVLSASSEFPHAPWMQPADEGSHLTFALAALAHRAGNEEGWVARAEGWCWNKLSRPDEVMGYLLKFALSFLDANPAHPHTEPALQALRHIVGPDGCVAVSGGTEDEKLTPLALSPHPDQPSRSLFTDRQIQQDLERLAGEQRADGGWSFDWLEWCPAQGLDWRGIQTVKALTTLKEHAYT